MILGCILGIQQVGCRQYGLRLCVEHKHFVENNCYLGG